VPHGNTADQPRNDQLEADTATTEKRQPDFKGE
jgi:hypothetical protein